MLDSMSLGMRADTGCSQDFFSFDGVLEQQAQDEQKRKEMLEFEREEMAEFEREYFGDSELLVEHVICCRCSKIAELSSLLSSQRKHNVSECKCDCGCKRLLTIMLD